jgi:hypothetical protein
MKSMLFTLVNNLCSGLNPGGGRLLFGGDDVLGTPLIMEGDDWMDNPGGVEEIYTRQRPSNNKTSKNKANSKVTQHKARGANQ